MRSWIVCLLLIVATGCALAQEAASVIPLKPDPPIAVDGDLSEWARVPNAIVINRREQATYNPQSWTGPADLSGIVHLAWRQEGLYLGIEITDDALFQNGRGDLMWKGDHAEVYVDTIPDTSPERTAFGAGQYQFGFSPGNFKHTGDALTDIAPEIACFPPREGGLAGIRYAAVKIPQGWTLEALIPFALLGGFQPATNKPLGLEIALSDTDTADPAQETFMTTSTKTWQRNRTRLPLMVLGDVQGQGSLPPQAIALGPEIKLARGQAQELSFPTPAIPTGRAAYLFLRARIDYKAPAGYTRGLQVSLNGTPLGQERLSNRPLKATDRGGREHLAMTPEGLLFTPYSPDFTAFDKHETYGLTEGVRACEFEFNISDLLRRDGPNVLKLQNMLPTELPLAVVVADAAVRLRTPPAPPAPKRPAPTGPLPLISPRTSLPAFTYKQPSPNALAVAIQGEKFTIESRFSTPDGKWQTGSCPQFTFTRKIDKRGECLIVRDTFRNLTSENLPLRQRHSCDLSGRIKQAWIGGISPPGGNLVNTEPSNPSSFAITQKAGLGLLPLNDEFQVHVRNSVLQGVLGLADDNFVLRPGATYTAEWAVIPTARPDFWDFVNAARRVRGSNFTLQHQFAFLSHGPRSDVLTDAQFLAFFRNRGATLACTTINYPRYKGRYAHGTPFQLIDRSAYAAFNDRVRRLCPDIKSQVYFHCFLDVLEDADKVYPDDRVLLSNGQQANYGHPEDRIFCPTLTNKFGQSMSKNVDLILGDCKADGVYWDEMDYSAYQYNYGEPWDGCTADIDPATGKLLRLKSSVALISQPFRAALVKRIQAHGPLLCNGCPHTRTMADLHYQCFVETASLTNCLRAVLYSPVALGDHISERKFIDCYRWMLGALDYGCLYNWYSDAIPVNQPNLAGQMFPTTPIELHQGYIIGKERIVTKRSGLFGWGDKSAREVHVFNDEGLEVKDFKAPTRVIDGQTYTELRLAEDWSAAIIRK